MWPSCPPHLLTVQLQEGDCNMTHDACHAVANPGQGDGLIAIGSGGRAARPKNTLPLLTSTVKLDAEDPQLRCCFRCDQWQRVALR